MKSYTLKLAPKLKRNKLLKLLLVDMKENNSTLMRLGMGGMAEKKQNCLENQVRSIS